MSQAQSGKSLGEAHPVRGETPQPRMAKADLSDLPKREIRSEREKKEAYGRMLKTVQHMLGKNRDEMAQLLNVDPRQLGRWYAGTESAQSWRYHAIPKVRRALRLVEAIDDTEGSIVETVIRAKLDLGHD